jgi:hypothetical protein
MLLNVGSLLIAACPSQFVHGLDPDEGIFRRITDWAAPVVSKILELCSLFCIIINITAYRAPPHNNLLYSDQSLGKELDSVQTGERYLRHVGRITGWIGFTG